MQRPRRSSDDARLTIDLPTQADDDGVVALPKSDAISDVDTLGSGLKAFVSVVEDVLGEEPLSLINDRWDSVMLCLEKMKSNEDADELPEVSFLLDVDGVRHKKNRMVAVDELKAISVHECDSSVRAHDSRSEQLHDIAPNLRHGSYFALYLWDD